MVEGGDGRPLKRCGALAASGKREQAWGLFTLPVLLSPIHPSPLPGGRLGGGWEVASAHEVVAQDAGRPLSRQCRLGAPTPLVAPPPPEGGRDELERWRSNVIPALPFRHSCVGRNRGGLQRLCAPRCRADDVRCQLSRTHCVGSCLRRNDGKGRRGGYDGRVALSAPSNSECASRRRRAGLRSGPRTATSGAAGESCG